MIGEYEMQKYLMFKDGQRHEISPLSYREFVALDLWHGASDMAFANWLRYNNLVEVDDFTHEALTESTLVIELTARSYVVNLIGDVWIQMESPTYSLEPMTKPDEIL